MVFQYYEKQFSSALLNGCGKRIFTNELEQSAKRLNKNKREIFSDYICNIAWLCDFANTVLNDIMPLINNGVTVFVDRYSLCAKVYSVATTTQPIDNLFSLYSYFPNPDVCIYLSTNPKEAMRRIERRNEQRAYYETVEYLEKIKNTYEIFIPKESYQVEMINSECTLQEEFLQTIKILDRILTST